MVRGLYIAGTASNVGKTLVGRALAAALVRRGRRVAVLKPVETGCPLRADAARPLVVGGIPGAQDPAAITNLRHLADLAGPPPADGVGQTPPEALQPLDAQALLRAAGLEPALLDLANPYRFAPELEPAVAARLAGTSIELAVIEGCYRELARQADLVLVEGTGGLMAPLAPGLLMEQLPVALDLAVLLVVPSAYGAINSCLLNLQRVRDLGLPLAGVVLNRLQRRVQPEEAANPYQIELHAGAVVRGVLPYLEAAEREDLDLLARRLTTHVDLEAVLAALAPADERAET